MPKIAANPHRPDGLLAQHLRLDPDGQGVAELLKLCPKHTSTPLISAPDLAKSAGVATLFIKDERGRMGLGSFKALGAAYAIAKEADSTGVYGFRFRGTRFDCGSKAGFLQATVAFGLARPDLRDTFRNYLLDVLAESKAAE